MKLSLVESSGIKGNDWQTLGRYEGDEHEDQGVNVAGSRMIGFEINLNGLLSVRSQTRGVLGSTRPKAMPTPSLSGEDIASWKQWLDKIM
jgi:hypothetical protein